jgi:hypothetical protein
LLGLTELHSFLENFPSMFGAISNLKAFAIFLSCDSRFKKSNKNIIG